MDESHSTTERVGERLVAIETKIDGMTTLLNTRLGHIEHTQQTDREHNEREFKRLEGRVEHLNRNIKEQGEKFVSLLDRKTDKEKSETLLRVVNEDIAAKADKADVTNLSSQFTELRTDLKKAVWTVLTPLLVALVAVAGVGGTLTYFNQRHASPAPVQQSRVPPVTPPAI